MAEKTDRLFATFRPTACSTYGHDFMRSGSFLFCKRCGYSVETRRPRPIRLPQHNRYFPTNQDKKGSPDA